MDTAFAAYEQVRRPATAAVVLANRTHPPGAILREVHERTGDRPFARIQDVITGPELEAILTRYRLATGHPAAP